MASKLHAHLSLVTLGVSDVARSARFYEELGFVRKMRKTGEEVAFFEAGGAVLSLYRADKLAEDMSAAHDGYSAGFRGITLAWNCKEPGDVEAVIALAVKAGGTLVRSAYKIFWGGHVGFFADPDGHVWEVAHNPGFGLSADGRLTLPD